MKCAACGHEIPVTCQFCVQCHAPVHFICPACHHEQNHGGKCEACGVEFIKYAGMLVFRSQTNLQQARDRKAGRNEIIRQILLLPITGGWSLLRHLLRSKTGS